MKKIEKIAESVIRYMRDNGLTSTEMLKVVELTKEKLTVKYPLVLFDVYKKNKNIKFNWTIIY